MSLNYVLKAELTASLATTNNSQCCAIIDENRVVMVGKDPSNQICRIVLFVKSNGVWAQTHITNSGNNFGSSNTVYSVTYHAGRWVAVVQAGSSLCHLLWFTINTTTNRIENVAHASIGSAILAGPSVAVGSYLVIGHACGDVSNKLRAYVWNGTAYAYANELVFSSGRDHTGVASLHYDGTYIYAVANVSFALGSRRIYKVSLSSGGVFATIGQTSTIESSTSIESKLSQGVVVQDNVIVRVRSNLYAVSRSTLSVLSTTAIDDDAPADYTVLGAVSNGDLIVTLMADKSRFAVWRLNGNTPELIQIFSLPSGAPETLGAGAGGNAPNMTATRMSSFNEVLAIMSSTGTLHVFEVAASASFTMDKNRGPAPLTVQFTVGE